MPHDLVTTKQSVVLKETHGGHDLVMLNKYDAPSTPDGQVAHDPHRAMDQANAKWMMEVLQEAYPGHLWRTVHDGAQRMAYVSIPILMGINKFWAINLTTDQMTQGLLVRCGGALLERYGLRRGRFHLGEFLEARDRHSALVVPTREVPR